MRLRENHNYIPTTKNYTTACEFKTPFLRYCAALHHIWLLMKIFGSFTFLILCMVSAIQKKKNLTLEDFCLGRALLVRRYQSGNIC